MITVSTKEFTDAFKKCQKVVAKKPTLPILGSVKVESNNGVLSIYATDLANFIKVNIPCVIVKEIKMQNTSYKKELELCDMTPEEYEKYQFVYNFKINNPKSGIREKINFVVDQGSANHRDFLAVCYGWNDASDVLEYGRIL